MKTTFESFKHHIMYRAYTDQISCFNLILYVSLTSYQVDEILASAPDLF
jgi:hypothetical protein